VTLSARLVQREYVTFFDILDHIKKTGTGGYHEKVPHLSRPVLKSLSKWFADRGRYVITYEMYILTCHGVRGKKI
jgi:hypothetical protein